MKRLLILTMILLSNLSISACGGPGEVKKSEKSPKILIIYYSLLNGNTRIVAEQIERNTGGDIFRIETVEPYPEKYDDVTSQAKKEIEANYKPAIKSGVRNIDQYDIIFVGSPNWWSTFAPAISTFLSTHDLAGKTIVPFITHEGSRLGRSVADLKKMCPQSTIAEGLAVRGSDVNDAESEVQKWLSKIGITKN